MFGYPASRYWSKSPPEQRRWPSFLFFRDFVPSSELVTSEFLHVFDGLFLAGRVERDVCIDTSLLRSHVIKLGVCIAIKIPHAGDFFQSRHKISIKSGTKRKNERITPLVMTQETTSKPPKNLNKIDDL